MTVCGSLKTKKCERGFTGNRRLYYEYFTDYRSLLYPTGSTKRVTEWITERIAGNREAECLDLTDAASSRPDYTFTEHELAVVGVPVYGGRVPETARERLQKSTESARRRC